MLGIVISIASLALLVVAFALALARSAGRYDRSMEETTGCPLCDLKEICIWEESAIGQRWTHDIAGRLVTCTRTDLLAGPPVIHLDEARRRRA